ncbi:hypothetical protein [Haloferula sp.]|uniref:hypothetical protein n=1 Tax=Haloferula sp. TaxID=2497595 RepID=UPI0032A0F41A
MEDIPYSSNDRKGQHYDFDQSGRLVIGVGKRVARLLPSGEPDPAFATGGLLELWLLLGSSANHVTFIKPISSGNILVGGLSTTLTEAGNLDKTHENPGVSDTTLQAIETYDGQVMTLNSTTSGPSVVGATGDANISTTFPGAIQIAYDGIPRYHGSRDGGLVSVNLLDGVEVVTGTDIGFSAGGGTVHGQSNIFRLPSGRFVAVANLSGQVTTLLLEPDGSLDTHLGGTGSMPVPQGDSIGLQTAIFYPNGSYVMGSANNLIKVQGELDTDGDQIPDRDESKSGTYSTALDPGTDPLNPDTDGDGLNDGQEVYRHGSNPHKTDSDHDGINDAYEVQTGFSPIDPLSHPAAGMNIYSAVELEVITKIGTVYRIQASMDNENWTDTNLVIEGTGGAIREIFRQTTSSRAMFWRAREE